MLKLVFMSLGFLVIIYSMIVQTEIYWIALPCSYFLLNLILPSALRNKNSYTGLSVFNIVVFIKYIVMPFSFTLAKNPTSELIKNVLPASMITSMYLLIIDLFVSLLVIQFFNRKLLKINEKNKLNLSYQSNFKYVVLLLLVFALFAAFPSLIFNYHFFIIKDSFGERQTVDESIVGIISIFTDLILIIPSLIVIYWSYSKYKLNNSKTYYYISLLSIIPPMMIFKGFSRFSVLIPSIVWITIMVRLYPKFKKITSYISIMVITLVMVSISLYKIFKVSSTDYNSAKSFEINFNSIATNLNAYFSGVQNLSYAIEIKDSNKLVNFQNIFFNDFFRNIVFFSRFSNQNLTSSVLFNNYLYDPIGIEDQIVPMTGQSLFYFGYYGSWILTAICIFIMLKLSERAYKEKSISKIYLYTFLSIYFSLSMMITINSIYSIFFNFFIPIYFALKIGHTKFRV